MFPLCFARRAASIALALVATACLPPERPNSTSPAGAPPPVRVWEHGADKVRAGLLVRVTADSVVWRPEAQAMSTQALPLAAVTRIEVAEPLSQRAALRRGLVRGALVGAALGAGLLALRPKAVGGAVGLTLGSAWIAGIVSGQQVESPHPPVRWRVVYPRNTD